MIIALAGRRIDESKTETARFPMANVPIVKERLKILFQQKGATGLVCSAACGADLLALQAAGDLGVRRKIILPSEPEAFRQSSVIDRPGSWGGIFDKIYRQLKHSGDVSVMKTEAKDDELYLEANDKILDQAVSLAAEHNKNSRSSAVFVKPDNDVLVVIVWEGNTRGENDITADFANKGRQRGFEVVEVMTK